MQQCAKALPMMSSVVVDVHGRVKEQKTKDARALANSKRGWLNGRRSVQRTSKCLSGSLIFCDFLYGIHFSLFLFGILFFGFFVISTFFPVVLCSETCQAALSAQGLLMPIWRVP